MPRTIAVPRRYNPALSLSREAVSRAVRLLGTLPMQGERSSSLQVEMAGFRFVIEADIWHYAVDAGLLDVRREAFVLPSGAIPARALQGALETLTSPLQ